LARQQGEAAIHPGRAIVLVVALAAALACAGTASAGFTAFPDRNDKPGPLDIRQATQGHGPGGRLVHSITTFGRWPNALLGPTTPNFFLLEISIDADAKPERTVFIYSVNRHMVGVVLDSKGKAVAAAKASRPNRKTLKVSFPRAGINDKPGYRWSVASFFEATGRCGGGCVDKAPNRGRILHDIAKPVVDFPDPPTTSGMTSYDIDFTITDPGSPVFSSGIAGWELQHRDPATMDWVPIADSVTSPTLPHPYTDAVLGVPDTFRVVTLDVHGNRGVSREVTVTTSR
jgi:hypothetical protein